MDINTLSHDVRVFRCALDSCHSDLDATIFGHFPRGCCGAVAELLATFLKGRGHGDWAYVCGNRNEGEGRRATHAWLEQGKLIVDITRDQFGEDVEPALVTTDSSWHNDEFPEQEKPGDFGYLAPELCQAYARIEEEIESRSGVNFR